MATATAIAPTTTTAAPATSIPFAPAGLQDWQARAIIHSGELATANGLHLIGRGTCRVAGHVGEPVYIVSSASRPDGAHLVWIESGRILCDCPRRTKGHGFTCSHAQFVRLLIVAELADARNLPDAARVVDRLHVAPKVDQVACPHCGAAIPRRALETYGACLDCRARFRAERDATPDTWTCEPVTAAPAPEPEPEPEPPAPKPTRRTRRPRASAADPASQSAAADQESSAPADGPAAGDGHDRQPCPNCGALTDAAELAELGECLSCLQMRADYDRAAAADARAIEEWAQAETERMAEELAQQLPCWCCGEPATAETNHGLYCDECVKLAPGEQRRRARGRLAAEKVAQTRARVDERAKERKEARARAAAERKADHGGDGDMGIYHRRDFSIWKADENR